LIRRGVIEERKDHNGLDQIGYDSCVDPDTIIILHRQLNYHNKSPSTVLRRTAADSDHQTSRSVSSQPRTNG